MPARRSRGSDQTKPHGSTMSTPTERQAGRERALAEFPARKMVRAHERMYIEMLAAAQVERKSEAESETRFREKVALGL